MKLEWVRVRVQSPDGPKTGEGKSEPDGWWWVRFDNGEAYGVKNKWVERIHTIR